MGLDIPAFVATPKAALKKLLLLAVVEIIGLALVFSGLQLCMYSLLAVVFSYMCVEDYLNKEVDVRLCLVLIALVAFSGKEYFLVNFGLGYIFFHVWYYMLCRKVRINVDLQQFGLENKEMGFLPSIALGILIWCLGRQFILEEFVRWDDFALFCIAILGCTVWGILHLYWSKNSKEENSIIQAGFGEGDIYICAIGFSFFGPSEFLIILFLSLLVHLILYKFEYFFGR